MKIKEFEKLLGFKNKIKWKLSFAIIAFHITGIWMSWYYALPAKPMTILFSAVMYIFNILGITCGVHRLLSHKCYKTNTPLKIFLIICFTAAGQNSVYQWVRDHRLHHRASDTEADPHNAKRGLFFSHMGWLMTVKNDEVKREGKKTDMSDMENDKYVMFVSRTMTECSFVKAQSDNLPKIDTFMMTIYFASNPDFTSAEVKGVKAARHTSILTILLTFILPSLANILLWGENWRCAIAWQCFIRYLCVMHSQLSVNSLAHAYGYKPYNKNIMPNQNKFISAVSLGEGWHNYHHVFPFDYKAAEFCDYFNSSATAIQFWAKMGWAYDLKEATPEMIKSVCERLGDGVQRMKN